MANNVKNTAYADDENIGKIQISEQVVSVIAGIAATETDGVDSLIGNITTEIVSRLGISSLSKGVKIKMLDDTVFVYLTLNIKYGHSVPEVCGNVQEKVSSAIETMTGLSVAEVNVIVSDVVVDKK